MFFFSYQAYIRLMSALYRSWISFRFSLNAAVTRPLSGVHTSLHNVTAAGISNFCNLPAKSQNKLLI